MYHWCPGDDSLPEWGFNWDWALCHDDHHRESGPVVSALGTAIVVEAVSRSSTGAGRL
jgi:hypothetical protein